MRPTWIPQLADAAEVVARLPRRDDVRYWGLIPNLRGLERALGVGLGHVATFMSASETHNKKNLNRTRRESLSSLSDVIGTATDEGLVVRGVHLDGVRLSLRRRGRPPPHPRDRG